MSDSPGRDDIRRLLKTFGIQADDILVTHLVSNPSLDHIRVRLTLEDLTDYGADPPQERVRLVVEGGIQREAR